MSTDMNGPQGSQDRTPSAAGQDEVENGDRYDNLQDADTLADLAGPETPALGGLGSMGVDDAMDDQTDGDRQLTTDSDAIDGGLNDSDLGADVAGLPSPQDGAEGREGFSGLGPDTSQTGGGSTGDRATGVMDLRG